jgi:hypothetical protein
MLFAIWLDRTLKSTYLHSKHVSMCSQQTQLFFWCLLLSASRVVCFIANRNQRMNAPRKKRHEVAYQHPTLLQNMELENSTMWSLQHVFSIELVLRIRSTWYCQIIWNFISPISRPWSCVSRDFTPLWELVMNL